MAFGHSRGAYTTTGLVASYPAKFSCAGHTAGGAIPQTGYSAPSTTLAAQISCPYIIHHGDSDMVVPVFYDSTLNNVFDTTGIPHQFYVYPGLSHSQMSMDSVMYVRTQSWFLNHLCITSGVADVVSEQMPFNIFPNPFRDQIIIQNPGGITHLDIYDLAGRRVYDNQDILPGSIPLNLSGLDTGIYLVRLSGAATSFRKIIKK
jgi:hypothetical protein